MGDAEGLLRTMEEEAADLHDAAAHGRRSGRAGSGWAPATRPPSGRHRSGCHWPDTCGRQARARDGPHGCVARLLTGTKPDSPCCCAWHRACGHPRAGPLPSRPSACEGARRHGRSRTEAEPDHVPTCERSSADHDTHQEPAWHGRWVPVGRQYRGGTYGTIVLKGLQSGRLAGSRPLYFRHEHELRSIHFRRQRMVSNERKLAREH